MELSVFNVGRGSANAISYKDRDGEECVGIVDCFCGPSSKKKNHPLLAFLEEKESDFRIPFIVLTHYHHDHYFGIQEILEKHGSRVEKLFHPGLDFETFVAVEYPEIYPFHRRGSAELRSIEDFKQQYPRKSITLSAPDTEIYSETGVDLTVRSLAPASFYLERTYKAYTRQFKKIAEEYSKKKTLLPKSSKLSMNLNQTSSAILCEVGQLNVVFGGDVPIQCWNSVLSHSNNREISNQSANLFVLSHHGSSDAYTDEFWKKDLLNKETIFVVSGRGRKQPDEAVLDSLKQRNCIVYGTSGTAKSSRHYLHEPSPPRYGTGSSKPTESDIMFRLSDGLVQNLSGVPLTEY